MATETEEERTFRLKRFVMDYCDGNIFTSMQVHEPEQVSMVFMVLIFMEKDQIPPDAAFVWEHMSKQAPRSINGYPTFFSCYFMDKADAERVIPAIDEELKRRKEIKV
jgi:hypothetical protein